MGESTVVKLALVLSLLIVQSVEATRSCGEREVTAASLMIGGYKAPSGAWPWHGAVFHKLGNGLTGYVCGAVVVTEQFVLTAAHCTYKKAIQKLPSYQVFIKVGLTNLDSPEEHVRQFAVDKIIRHEQYDSDTFENDIALLMLSSEITFNNHIQPVCLWQGDTQLSKIVSKLGFLVAWEHREGYSLAKHLSEAKMPIVSSRTCWESDKWHYSKYYFESKTFCAGRRNHHTYASRGDSGSGLYMRMGANWILRGIVSNAKVNPSSFKIQKESYTIFTDVAYYLNWIKTKVPGIPRFAVDTKKIIETDFDNLLLLKKCGKVTYPSGSQRLGKEFTYRYPWEVFINTNSTRLKGSWCNGFLIHTRFLITSASCLKLYEFDHIFAWIYENPLDLIDNDDNSFENSSARIRIDYTFAHPNFGTPMYANDIAMAKLVRSTTVIPICLPKLDAFKLPDATQFHFISFLKRNITIHLRNKTQLVDSKACQREYAKIGTNLTLTRGQFCSTLTGMNVDSRNIIPYLVSAPLQYVKNESSEDQYFLTAFTSYEVRGKSLSEFPSLFTNVAYHSKFIIAFIVKSLQVM